MQKVYDGSNKIAKKTIRDFDISFGDDLTRAESELEMEKWKNSTIRNCWISAREEVKLYPFGTSAEQSEACVLKE